VRTDNLESFLFQGGKMVKSIKTSLGLKTNRT